MINNVIERVKANSTKKNNARVHKVHGKQYTIRDVEIKQLTNKVLIYY